MKIAVIAQDSQSPTLHTEISCRGRQALPACRVIGGIQQIAAVAEQEQPDLLMLEGQFFSPMELQILNRVTSRFPDLGVVMLCPDQSPERLIEVMRAGVREVLPTPLTRNVVIEAVERFQQRIMMARMPVNQCKVLAFIPCKGGSGATFLATNIAYALAALENKRVALFDFNLQFGDASLFVHDRPPTTSIADVRARSSGWMDHSWLPAWSTYCRISVFWLHRKSPSKLRRSSPSTSIPLFQVAMKHYDFVILDVGRELDAISIQALDRADLFSLCCSKPFPPSANAKRVCRMCFAR